MACATCNTPIAPSGSYTGSYSSACAAGGSPGLSPRRVSTQAVTPVTFNWLPSVRFASEGQLLVRDGSEMLSLEAPFDGQVLYDSTTGKAYVGTLAASTVSDTACVEDFVGLPTYAQNPGCQDIGSHPDRNFVVVRPTTTNSGYLFGHLHNPPPGPAQAGELTPVEIDPALLPPETPEGLREICYYKPQSNDQCSAAQPLWYYYRGMRPLDRDQVGTTGLILTELQDTTDAVNFAVWRLINGKWVLFRLRNEDFKALIATNVPSNRAPLTVRHEVMFQHKSISPGSFDNAEYFPAIPAPVAFPIVNQATVVDLTTIDKYFAEATYVEVSFSLKGVTVNQFFDGVLTANGIEYCRIAVSADNASNANNIQANITIPSDKKIPFNFYYQNTPGGSPSYLLAQIYITAFGR